MKPDQTNAFRITTHPILEFEDTPSLPFTFEGQKMIGKEGDTIASALIANGIKVFSHSINLGRPRGFYCAIGNCASCNMVVDGKPNIRTCITPLKAGMEIRRQVGKGTF
jgi:predicted molibdopterin-dependent oxidoreductase YjgC